MTAPYDEDMADEDDVEGVPAAILSEDDDAELSLDALEEIEEDENAGHRVVTFDGRDDGERYFDGAYFDE